MTMMVGEQDNLWIAGLVSEFRVDSTHFSSGKSSLLPPPWSSKIMGLQQSLTKIQALGKGSGSKPIKANKKTLVITGLDP